MCGRYSLVPDADQLRQQLNVDPTQAYTPRYNAAPTQLLPVVTNQHPQGLSFFYWGLIPQWSGNRSLTVKLFNARSETLAEKVSFRKALAQRRCLVPADGFYEWKSISKKGKVPYRFRLTSAQVFTFAGLWEEFEGDDGQVMHTFTICTTQANEEVAAVHDRMPVMFTDSDSRTAWLSDTNDQQALLDLLRPLPAELMESYAVSPRVNRVENDDPQLIDPAPPADQFGNLSLFS